MDSYREVYRELAERVGKSDAMTILSSASGLSRANLLRDFGEECRLTTAEYARQCALRLERGEPLAYILGECEFYGLKLRVTPNVLIPRVDSEEVVDAALNILNHPPRLQGNAGRPGVRPLHRTANIPPSRGVSRRGEGVPGGGSPRILDLCCGSGCLGLALLSKLPNSTLTAVDISEAALIIAQQNAVDLFFNDVDDFCADRVTTLKADVLKDTPPADMGVFDLIISNPPYVTADEMPLLDQSVANYEPHLALYGGADGLDFYRALRRLWSPLLAPDGAIVLECGYAQRDAVEALFEGVNAIVVATGGEIV